MSKDEIKGLDELLKALGSLPERFEKSIMKGAIRAGSNVIAAEAKALVPVAPPNEENARLYGGRRGLLKASIRVMSPDYLPNGYVKGGVRAGGDVKGTKRKAAGDAYYAHFVEYGTAPHKIMAAKGKRLAIGGAPVGTSVMHPGAKAKPFMRPALDAKREAAMRAVAEYIRNRLATKHGLDVPAPEDRE